MEFQRFELSEAFGVHSLDGGSFILPPGTAVIREAAGGFSLGIGNHEPIEIAAQELARLFASSRPSA